MIGDPMHILVTGGAGFIGSNYVKRILDGTLSRVSSLRVIDNLSYAGNLDNFTRAERSGFEFVKGDIRDAEKVNSAIIGVDAVINFAAESHVDRSIKSAQEFVSTNVQGTQNLLDACRNLEVENYVQVSTDEVYGSINTGSWSETEPLLPNSPYAASKAAADLMVRAANRTHNLNARITRCSNNYGPNQYPEKVIPLFVTNLIEGKRVPVYGEGKNVRDWLHVDDHCRGIHLVLKGGKPGEIYNIGGGRELSNLELTNVILNSMGKSDSAIEYVADRIGHDQRYSVNFEKIHKDLGYAPSINFDEGLQNTIDWYLSNEEWWKPLKQQK
jgi:dTDP-glucose 4,6-dehydratase